MRSPIFVIGSPRSGTTLIRLMLTCHRNIVIPPECSFAIWWYEKYKGWAECSESHILGFMQDLMQSKKIETWQINKRSLFKFLGEREPSSYSQLVSAIYEWYGLSQYGTNFKRWGDKNNWHLSHIPTIKELFPTAYFVHIIRDGRGVAGSYRELNARKIRTPYAPNLPNGIEEIAEQWKTNVETARESFERIQWENVCEIRFEDILLETEKSLRNLCYELDEDYDPSMLNYHSINKQRSLEPAEFLKWKEQTLQPIVKSEVSRYRQILSAQEIITFEEITGDVLRGYGYL